MAVSWAVETVVLLVSSSAVSSVDHLVDQMAYYWVAEMVVMTAELMEAPMAEWKVDLMVSMSAV